MDISPYPSDYLVMNCIHVLATVDRMYPIGVKLCDKDGCSVSREIVKRREETKILGFHPLKPNQILKTKSFQTFQQLTWHSNLIN